jgi:predicted Fe-Mo cluster-binding NifX family protein
MIAMKTAFAYWENRIAPVFDTARDLLLVESEGEHITREERLPLADEPPLARTLRLVELGVETLVCGAISRALQEMLLTYGIRVQGFVAGDLHEVVRAWLEGKMNQEVFAMPGCLGRGGHGRWSADKENIMQGRGRNTGAGGGQGQGAGRRQGQGMGQGAGQGMGQGMAGRGRRGGALAGGPAGACVCPKCGHQQSHERGCPCVEQACPQCGTSLVRS